MLQNFHRSFLHHALKRVNERPAPTLIPRSLPAAATVDCYVATIDSKRDERSWLVTRSEGCAVHGRRSLGGGYEEQESEIPDEVLQDCEIEITHFLKVDEFKYRSAISFLVSSYLRLHLVPIVRNRLAQYQFNRRHLVRADRIAILRAIYEDAVAQGARNTKVNVISLAAEMYGVRYIFHPSADELNGHMQLILDSLVESGDLVKADLGYGLAPKALTTMASHEVEEARHKDMVGLQRLIIVLTLILAGVAVFEAILELRKILS